MNRLIHTFIHSLSTDEMLELEVLQQKREHSALNGSTSYQVECYNAIDKFIDEKVQQMAETEGRHRNAINNLVGF